MEGLDGRNVLIGSYTQNTKKPGIYIFKPKMQSASSIISTINPSYILTNGDYTYFVCEQKKGQLITLNKQYDPISVLPTNGDDPCHISIDPKGNYLVVTNYSSGNFLIFTLQNGVVKEAKYSFVHEGSSKHPERQKTAHPHCSVFSPDSSILFVTDLGTDVVYYYQVTNEDIQVSKQKSTRLTEGSGPRTICLGPHQEKTLLISCELDSTVRILSYKNGLEVMAAYQLSSNPQNLLSEVVYNNGLVYLTSRGENYLVIFYYQSGTLKEKFRFKVGDYPRHVLVLGNELYVACNKGGTVERYRLENQKVLQLSVLNIAGASCVAVIPWE